MIYLDQRQTKKCSRNLKMLNFNAIELRFLLGEKADFFAQILECKSRQDLKRRKPKKKNKTLIDHVGVKRKRKFLLSVTGI